MDLSEEQIDALKEVTNIAAGKAATALSEMLSTQTIVMMNVEKDIFFNIEDFHDGSYIHQDSLVLGFRALLSKSIHGVVFIVIRYEDLINLLKNMKYYDQIPKIVNCIEEIDEFSRSALQEFGNILISQYCSAISDFLHIVLYHEVPSMVIGEYFSLLDGEFAQTAIYSDKILVLRTEISTKEQTIIGEMLFIPNVDSYNLLLEKLTVNGILGVEKEEN